MQASRAGSHIAVLNEEMCDIVPTVVYIVLWEKEARFLLPMAGERQWQLPVPFTICFLLQKKMSAGSDLWPLYATGGKLQV